MPFGKSKSINCAVCHESFDHCKRLSNHIKKQHQLKIDDYYVRYFCNNVVPLCIECNAITRFVSISEGFKKYCKLHASLAQSIAGHVGGKIKSSWNKGLNKFNDERILRRSIEQTGSGNHFYGKKHCDETLKKIAHKHKLNFQMIISRIQEANSSVICEFNEEDYHDNNSLLNIACSICKTKTQQSLTNIVRCWTCKNCNPTGSKQQNDIVDYVKELLIDEEVISSTRKIIAPYEIDVWIPSRNVAIEFHGLYWHSGGKNEEFDKKRHRKKYELCKEKGIKLIQIFSDEWLNSKETVKSIIAHALKKSTKKLNARDCTVSIIDQKTSKKFLDQYHVSGSTRSTKHYGLTHKTIGLVGVLTVRKPIQKKWGEQLFEISRMAFVNNCSIRGGASKLISWVEKNLNDRCNGLISYAELRYGEGKVYEDCGFERKSDSITNYWYTDGIKRYDRFKFRAQQGLSEKDVAIKNNVRPVYGCGNAVYVKLFQKHLCSSLNSSAILTSQEIFTHAVRK